MAIKPLQGLTSEWYEPEREKQNADGSIDVVEIEEGAILTGFKVRPLSGAEYFEVADLDGLKLLKTAFRIGLEDWRNFTDEDFSKAKAAEIIPAKYQMAIGRKVMSISSFDGEQVKNS